MVYHVVYHTSLPYRLPYMVYPVITGKFPLKSRLTEEGGAPPSVDIEKCKNAISNIMRKKVNEMIFKLGE